MGGGGGEFRTLSAIASEQSERGELVNSVDFVSHDASCNAFSQSEMLHLRNYDSTLRIESRNDNKYIDCHEFANANSHNDDLHCHTERSEVSLKKERDISLSAKAQYDKATNTQANANSCNDGVSVVDCHEVVPTSRNDKLNSQNAEFTHPQTPSARERAFLGYHSVSQGAFKGANTTQNTQRVTNSQANPKLHLLHTATQGKGAVIADAFALIDADIYIMIDADLQYDTKILPQALQTFNAQSLDMLNISRKAAAGTHRRGHSLGNALFTKCVQMLFGKKFNDLFSGYRIFSRAFVKSFPATSKGFEIETELTVFALQCNLRVGELEAPYRKRLEGSFSKLRTFKDGFRILRVIFGLLFTERPLLVFGILSGLCFALGLILGVPIVVEFVQTSAVPRFPTIIAIVGLGVVSVVLGIAGLLAHLITRNAKEMRRFVYLKHSHKRAKSGKSWRSPKDNV